MLNLAPKLTLLQSLAPVNITTNTVVYGTPVALAYTTTNLFVFSIGLVGGTFTPKLQQSLNGGSTWADVAAADLDATLVAVTAANDPRVQEVSYKGTAGLLRPVVTVTGVSTGGVASVVAALGNTRNFGHITGTPVPSITSANVGLDGSTITVVLSEPVTSSDWDAGWSVTADASPLTITNAALNGTSLTLTVDETITDNQVVVVTYSSTTGFYKHSHYYLGSSSVVATVNSSQMVIPRVTLSLTGRVPTFA